MEESIANKAVKGTIWSAVDRFGTMGLQFIVNIVLARLLTPDDFGAIGMLYIFIAVSQTFIDGGFGSALIQKKHPTDTDYSTILYWNITVGILFYVILYCSAPFIAAYYKIEVLKDVLRVIGISLILNGIVGLQINRLQKILQFNTIAKTNIFAYIAAAFLSIVLALHGYGVWSLVVMAIAQPLFRCIIIFIITRWRPKGSFSLMSFKSLTSFGGYLLLGNILESICKNLQGLIIGRKFSADQMGYYTQADKLDQIVSYSLPQVIASVMYPVFSKFQDDNLRLQELVLLNLRVISFVIYPLLFLLIIIANHLIPFLYGNQWAESISYFQILCCGGIFYSLNNIPYYAIAAYGKSKSLFILSFYKWSAFGLLVLVGMNFGMTGILCAIAVSYMNIFFANCMLARKYSILKIRYVIYSLFPSFALSAIIGGVVYSLIIYFKLYWMMSAIIYAILYISIAHIFKMKTYSDVKFLLSKLIRKN